MRTFILGETISWVDTNDRIKFIQNKNAFYSLADELKDTDIQSVLFNEITYYQSFLSSMGNLQTTTSYTIEIIKNDINNTTTTLLCRNFYLNPNRRR